MGFRISLYCTPKDQVDSIRNITDKDVKESDYEILNQLKGELIKYDTLANVLDRGDSEEKNLCTRIFNNKLDVECDCTYHTISKEQLKNIIFFICEHNNYEYMSERVIDYDKKEVGKFYTRNYCFPDDIAFEIGLRSLCRDYKYKCREWKTKVNVDNGEFGCPNINLNDKWFITDSWAYEYAVFNFVYLYKIFDWENNYLVAIGG